MQAKGTSRTTDPRSVLVRSVTVLPGHAVLDKASSEANCEDPDRRVQKLLSNRDLWSFDILSPSFVDFPDHRSPFANDSAML